MKDNEPLDPYNVNIGGVRLDPYIIAEAFKLPPTIAEALKKLLRLGRKHKTAREDAEECIKTVRRWLEIEDLLRGAGARGAESAAHRHPGRSLATEAHSAEHQGQRRAMNNEATCAWWEPFKDKCDEPATHCVSQPNRRKMPVCAEHVVGFMENTKFKVEPINAEPDQDPAKPGTAVRVPPDRR